MGAVSERYHEELEKVTRAPAVAVVLLQIADTTHFLQYIANNPDNSLETRASKKGKKAKSSNVSAQYSQKMFRSVRPQAWL